MIFTLSSTAKEDLREIARFTEAKWGKAQRDHYIRQLDASFHLLAQQPERAKSFDEIMPGYRRYKTGRHYIFLKQDKAGGIMILRILHEKMDVLQHLRDKEP